jgi:hypothetical protein
LEDILYRYEYGDLRPDPAAVRKPRSSRRRPAPTLAQRERLSGRSDSTRVPMKPRSARAGSGKSAEASKVAQKPVRKAVRVTH